MAHTLTNRGKLLLMQGQWDDAAAGAIGIGLLQGTSIPAGIDTAGEIADLNTITELLAASGVLEANFAGYARKILSRTNLAEDDANDRVNAAFAALTWAAAPAGQSIYGAFWYDLTTNTSDTTRLLMGIATWTAIPLNGSDFVIPAGDMVRAA
jgi:hypothetical protein